MLQQRIVLVECIAACYQEVRQYKQYRSNHNFLSSTVRAVAPQAQSFRAGGVQLSGWVSHFQINPFSRAAPSEVIHRFMA